MWRAFVTSSIAAVSLQYIDPFGTAKLVLFQVTSVSDTWRAFELVRLRLFLGSFPIFTHSSFRFHGLYLLWEE